MSLNTMEKILVGKGGNATFDSFVIKQEQDDIVEPTVSEVKVTLPMWSDMERSKTPDEDPGGQIVCTGDADGDQWVIQQVAMDGEGGQEDEYCGSVQTAVTEDRQVTDSSSHSADTHHTTTCSLQTSPSPIEDTTESVKQAQDHLTTSTFLNNHPSVLSQSVAPHEDNKNKTGTTVNSTPNGAPPSKRRKEYTLIKNLLGIVTDENRLENYSHNMCHRGQHLNEFTTQASPDTCEDTGEKTCELCSEVFTTPGSFQSHMLYHKSMETLQGNMVECAECKNEIPRHYIKYHVKIHSGEKPFECSICHKTFLHQRSFTHHIKIHARGKQVYKCKICKKDFAHEYLLRRHSVIHEKYTCPICGHYSTDKHSFESHKHKHETKVYKCDICGKNYSKEASVISHKCLVHMVTGKITVERLVMYKCDLCGDLFPEGFKLKDHIPSCQIKTEKL